MSGGVREWRAGRAQAVARWPGNAVAAVMAGAGGRFGAGVLRAAAPGARVRWRGAWLINPNQANNIKYIKIMSNDKHHYIIVLNKLNPNGVLIEAENICLMK